MALKDVIKEARLKKNLKQEDAAELVSVTVQTYSKWENGKTEPKASQVGKLSKILAVSTNEICNGEKSKKLDLIEFMKMVSEISKETSDFELKMAIWESIDDDNRFINNLRKYSSVPDRYLIAEQDEEILRYEAEKANDPDYYDDEIELSKDLDNQDEEKDFIIGLNSQERETYYNLVKKHKENEKTHA